jgi:hypothetical protein
MPHRLIGAAYVAVIVGGGWAANNYSSEQRSEEKLRSSETSCLQVGNPGRALDRLEADGNILQRRERFQPIVDCHRTYFDNEGEPVPLAFKQQLRYIEFIRRGVLPVIRPDGTVSAD